MGMNEFDRGGPFWLAAVVLFGVTGALLAPGCSDADVSAGELSAAANPSIEREVSDLQQQVAEADRGAQREIEQARANSENMPVAARDRLSEAIERTEEARDEAGNRLEELKNSGGTHWQARRSRVVEALDELEDARHDVVATFVGGEPSLSDG